MMNKLARLILAYAIVAAAAGAAFAATAELLPADPTAAPVVVDDTLETKRARLPQEWRWERQARDFDRMFRAR